MAIEIIDNEVCAAGSQGSAPAASLTEAPPTTMEEQEVPRDCTAATPLGCMMDEGGNSAGDDDIQEKQDRRRMRNAYKWYKRFARPSRETMCRIVDLTTGPDFTREDVDLMVWDAEETYVDAEAMKVKSTRKQKTRSRSLSFAKSSLHSLSGHSKKGSNQGRREAGVAAGMLDQHLGRPQQRRPSEFLQALDNESFHTIDLEATLDAEEEERSHHGVAHAPKKLSKAEKLGRNSGHTRSPCIVGRKRLKKDDNQAIDLDTSRHAVEEAHNRKREERRLKRAAVRKHSIGKENTVEEATRKAAVAVTVDNSEAARLQRAYRWYTTQAHPSRKNLKKRVRAKEIKDISTDDIDLLPWNFNGSLVSPARMNAMLMIYVKQW